MHVLVIGGSGRTGKLTINELLSKGHQVTTLARNPSALETLPGLNIIKGTPTDLTGVRTAFKHNIPGAVIVTLSAPRATESPFSAPNPDPRLMTNCNEHVVTVMKEYGVRKIVIMQAFGVAESWSNMPCAMRLLMSKSNMIYQYNDHNETERLIRASGLDYVFVRPTRLVETDEEKVKVWPNHGKGVPLMATISRKFAGIAAMDDSQISRKRPRPVVSCLRCREKKLKCDRLSPCVNCTKAACPAECTYSQGSGASDRPAKARRAPTSTDAVTNDQHPDRRSEEPGNVGVSGIIEDLQQRVAKLEELLSVRSGSVNCNQVPGVSIPDVRDEIEESEVSVSLQGTVVVKGNRTRYHGQNTRGSLLKQFPDAKRYIDQFIQDPVMMGLAKEVQFLQNKSRGASNSPASVLGSEFSPELMQLRTHLPPKAVCDQLVELYWRNFEGVLRVLHIPSFLRQYTQFWADLDSDNDRSSVFLPLITAVMTVSIKVADPNTKLGNQPAWEYLNNAAVNFIRMWQCTLGRKQQTEIATLQIGVLVVMARRLRLESAEEIWRATGTLVRSAMVVGLHLDLSQYRNLPVFQAEIRRRLLITIAEMDLQASIESGMPVMMPDLYYGALSPANLDDADFDDSTVELPPSKPLHEETKSLTQVILARSLRARINSMMFLKDVGPRKKIKASLEYGRVILEEELQRVPDSLKLDCNTQGDETPGRLLNLILLDIHIRRPLLCLYRSIAMLEDEEAEGYHALQQLCLESSLAILSYQDYFDPRVADLDISNSNVYWDLFQALCKNDILWAALSVCEHIKASGQNQHSVQTPFGNHSVGSLAKHTQNPSKASMIRTIESTLDALIRRLGDSGTNMKDIILLTIILQSVRSRGSAQAKDHWMQEGAKKAFAACRQHLLPSVANEFAAGNVADLAQMFHPNQALFSSNNTTGFTPQIQMPGLLGPSSALLDEFNDFQENIFSFDDASFAWNP
ncbi:Zn2Cys6 transcription factor [Aspergillus affinis]|uniref:Zn2Cys6 transcription factor n=1 Tax=Aspergillus affinis TaxID=1070780 RepID=UPI0022FDEA80|nr:Zn2Cys6 transcription factor [Aspergillus affinis]KAI9036891.1 Zn2Cys6 transcription factor [Aspergillus affinis]